VRRHAATLLVLALLLGTAVAFAETERLKLQPTPIEESLVQPAFSPVCECATSKAVIRLRLHRADTATVRVLDSSGTAIRVLVDRRRLPKGRTQLAWDGRDASGSQAPDGDYKVDVRLVRAGRTFTLPHEIALDTVGPAVRRVAYRREAEKLLVVYRLSEPGHGVLFVDGVQTVVARTTRPAAKLSWRVGSKRRYRLQVAGIDLAGNLGPRAKVAVLRTR
jgi:hypothetical protein